MNMIFTLSNEKQLEKIDSKDWLANLMTISLVHYNLLGYQLVKEICILAKICREKTSNTWLLDILEEKHA
jgi:hypothetical protein